MFLASSLNNQWLLFTYSDLSASLTYISPYMFNIKYRIELNCNIAHDFEILLVVCLLKAIIAFSSIKGFR